MSHMWKRDRNNDPMWEKEDDRRSLERGEGGGAIMKNKGGKPRSLKGQGKGWERGWGGVLPRNVPSINKGGHNFVGDVSQERGVIFPRGALVLDG